MKANEAPDTLLDLYMLSCMAELHNPIRLLYQKREHRSTYVLTVLIRKCFLFYFGFIILVYLLSFNFCFCLFLYRACFPRLESLNKFCRLRGVKLLLYSLDLIHFGFRLKTFTLKNFGFIERLKWGKIHLLLFFFLKVHLRGKTFIQWFCRHTKVTFWDKNKNY